MKKILKRLTALVVVLATGLFFLSACNDAVSYEKYANAELYTIGSASIAAADVKKVEIDWVNGNVEVEQTASQTLYAVEEKSAEKDAERMRYYLDGDVLKIKYCESGLRGSINAQNKNLRVELPAGIALDIDCVSAGVTVGVIDVTEFSVESVSGNVDAERIACSEAEIETVSGKVAVGELIATKFSLESVSGNFSVTRLSVDALEAETVSGALSFGIQKALRAEIESTSANVTFTLGEGLGARVRMETATGKFITEKQYGKTGTQYDVYGADGVSADCTIEVDVFSGNLYIK